MGRPPKKRGPGRPRKADSEKAKPAKKRGRPPKAKAADTRRAKAKTAARPKALSRAPVKTSGDLVAGKFVIASHGALLLKLKQVIGERANIADTEFTSSHAFNVESFEIFDSRGDAQLALAGLRRAFGVKPPEPAPKAESKVDLSFLDEGDDKDGKDAADVFEPVAMTADEAPETVRDGGGAGDELPAVPALTADPVLLEALTAAAVEPAKNFFATHYEIVGDENGAGAQLVKVIRWKEQATSLSAAVKAIRVALDGQVAKFKTDLKVFDGKVSVKRKELEADVKDAERVRDSFLKQARTYA